MSKYNLILYYERDINDFKCYETCKDRFGLSIPHCHIDKGNIILADRISIVSRIFDKEIVSKVKSVTQPRLVLDEEAPEAPPE